MENAAPVVTKKSEINITVGLTDSNMPVAMHWSASDMPGGGGAQECKAMALALFDKNHRDTLRIDLWTQDFQVNEMDRFVYHILRSLGDTYFKATQNKEMAEKMATFAQHFGEETEILPKK